MIAELIEKNRSYRRFCEDATVGGDVLERLVDLARLSPSAGNQQPLKFILSSDKQKNDSIFPSLAWAGFLKDWPGPAPGERPGGYIVVLCDTDICASADHDAGIAVQSILLGAAEAGLGGCIIGSINRKALRETLDIPEHLKIVLVVALGTPGETVVIEPLAHDGSIKYWRDEKDVHHVPKRGLKELIVGS